MTIRQEAQRIIDAALTDAMPGAAVEQALENIAFNPSGRLFLVAVGKAAWEMARSASERLRDRLDSGIIITKYGHSKGELERISIFEAGHPVPDENSFNASSRVIECVSDLNAEDNVLFLLSGGGSALFEKPLIPAEDLADITRQLLACGANIVEINTIRKRLS
ncbi:MAG: glycerate-2-kinase family protein, partial [Clostridia bacterium]|nr:glycerate-2-kinase family protein [Clostridia bacterium]